MHLLYTFLLTEAALGEYFKETWVRVNPNAPVTFIPDIINEENEWGDSGNVLIEVKLCDVGPFQKYC